MASVKSGRHGNVRFLSRSGISLEMGLGVILRFGIGDIQAVLAAHNGRFSASGQRWGCRTGVPAHVVTGRAARIAPYSKYPVETYNPSGESVAPSPKAGMGSKWSAGILGLFDPDRKKRSLGPAGVREAGLWQGVGLA